MSRSREGRNRKRGFAPMTGPRTDYTPGQMIRAEAINLYLCASRLREIPLRQTGMEFLQKPAEAAMKCLKTGSLGNITGLNRDEEYHESNMEMMQEAREKLESGPTSEEARKAWLLTNQCHQHSMAILGMMQRFARPRTIVW